MKKPLPIKEGVQEPRGDNLERKWASLAAVR